MVLFRLYTFSFLNLTPCRSNRIDQRRRPCRTAYTVHMCSLGVEDVFYGYDHSKYLSVQIPFGHLLKLDIPIQNFSTKVGAAVPHICTRHSRLSWSENVMLIYKISIYVCAACIQVLYVYDDIMGERIYISALDYDPFSMAMISSRADVFFFSVFFLLSNRISGCRCSRKPAPFDSQMEIWNRLHAPNAMSTMAR